MLIKQGQNEQQGTGVSNNLILINVERLSVSFNGRIIVRIPIIPGFNNDPDEEKLKI